MTFGFAIVLLFGLAAYAVAIIALRGLLGAKPATCRDLGPAAAGGQPGSRVSYASCS